MARLTALAAGVAAVTAAAAAGAAIWARRRAGGGSVQPAKPGRPGGRRAGRDAKSAAGEKSAGAKSAGATSSGAASATGVQSAGAKSRAAPKPATLRDAAVPTAATAPGPTPDVPGGTEAPFETLQSIRGIGAVSEERLRALGVTTVAQIATWSDADVESVAAQIKVSPERIRREDWAGQARAATKP